jgi:hypothetical protein
MRALLLLLLVVILVAGGLKTAGMRLPLIDYPIGPIGAGAPAPGMPDVQINPPGFDDLSAP